MRSEQSSSTKTASSWPIEALLAAVLTAGSALVYFYRPHLGDTRRWILALAATGFFLAPISSRPLRLLLWFPSLALVAWGGELAGEGRGGLWLWLACSAFGAWLAVRTGGRAARHYLPSAENADGVALQRSIRANVQAAFGLFAIVFVWDGFETMEPYARGAALAASAVFFLRYLLLQSKYLGITAVPVLRSADSRGIVPSQRWPLLMVLVVIGATRLPVSVLGADASSLLLTSLLLVILSGLLFVMALVLLQRRGAWPRRLVRRTSFFAGMGMAVALAAVVVELEAWGPTRFTSFTTACTFVLLVLPFMHATTALFDRYPNASFLVAPPVLAIMNAPLVAVNGERWVLASTGFLFAFAVLMLLYQLLVTVRERARGRLYLFASLAGLGAIYFSNGTAWDPRGSSWKIFLIALGFVLYSVDLLDRAARASGGKNVNQQ